ncbi:hypothetical protein [Halovulum sp. GXIMD14793]
MSENDSFLDEVTEEVRRDRLFKVLKKYSWLVAGVLILIIGGSGLNEYLKHRAQAAAEERGDAIILALQLEEPKDRVTAFETLLPNAAETAPLVRFQLAAAHEQNKDREKAIGVLRDLALDTGLSQTWRDTARLKMAMLGGDALPEDERSAILEQLSVPGHPLQSLAMEQRALAQLQAGEADAAISTFQDILELDGILLGVQQRARQMLTALGSEPRAPENTDDTANG